MTGHVAWSIELRCDGPGCKTPYLSGSDGEPIESVRADAKELHGWDSVGAEDFCPRHVGIALCNRGRRAIERAEAERHAGEAADEAEWRGLPLLPAVHNWGHGPPERST